MPLIYNELRALAKRYMRGERSGHTLQTTALVHEAYIKLGGVTEISWESRAHYLRVASQAMRRVLIDHARRKKADKKGGKRTREPLDRAADIMEKASVDLLELDSAIDKLAKIDPQLAQVVELRFFGGLTVEETAKVIGISKTTVKEDWSLAKAWLKQEMG